MCMLGGKNDGQTHFYQINCKTQKITKFVSFNDNDKNDNTNDNNNNCDELQESKMETQATDNACLTKIGLKNGSTISNSYYVYNETYGHCIIIVDSRNNGYSVYNATNGTWIVKQSEKFGQKGSASRSLLFNDSYVYFFV